MAVVYPRADPFSFFFGRRNSAESVASTGSCCWPVAWDWRLTWPSCWCSDSSCPAPKWISASARPKRGSSVSHRSVFSSLAQPIDLRMQFMAARQTKDNRRILVLRAAIFLSYNKRCRSRDSANPSRDEGSWWWQTIFSCFWQTVASQWKEKRGRASGSLELIDCWLSRPWNGIDRLV